MSDENEMVLRTLLGLKRAFLISRRAGVDESTLMKDSLLFCCNKAVVAMCCLIDPDMSHANANESILAFEDDHNPAQDIETCCQDLTDSAESMLEEVRAAEQEEAEQIERRKQNTEARKRQAEAQKEKEAALAKLNTLQKEVSNREDSLYK